MEKLPRISIVTCSYNQATFIGRTIESVLAQNYPNLEHIVVDGMSSDETPAVLARYPHLRVIREPDQGQADAINKGFRAATGEILGFLNSDDTLLPGALRRVAREIDPARGRQIVMGRCRFIDEHDTFLGVEHPSAFESHRRVLEIWKGYCIPQPAVFWTREVWERCGPLNEREHLMLDYDLFCRFSQRYRFHPIDQVFATYRLHTESKTSAVSDQERLEQAIAVSRRYWGPPTRLQYWQILCSYGMFRLDRRRRAVGLLRQGREAWRQARRLRMLPYVAAGALLAPDVLADALLAPVLKPYLARLLNGRVRLAGVLRPRPLSPQTLAWRDFCALHSDSWAGPTLIMPITVEPGHTQLCIEGTTGGFRMPRSLELELFIDGRRIARRHVGRSSEFRWNVPVAALAPGDHELRIVANSFVVPHNVLGIDDYRPLAFKLKALTLSNQR